ncbi:MAG: hypothetical protein KC545_06155, partial [Nitrospira sp.]|nr:hypothetical protein [Nitrospira sp.]
ANSQVNGNDSSNSTQSNKLADLIHVGIPFLTRLPILLEGERRGGLVDVEISYHYRNDDSL